MSYELIDARTHGHDIERPLIVVEQTPWSSKHQYRRVFDFHTSDEGTALEVLRALNERDIAEGEINAA